MSGIVIGLCTHYLASTFTYQRWMNLVNEYNQQSLKNKIVNLVNKNIKDEQTLVFCKLLVFNIKTPNVFLDSLYNLNVAHLFVVSGLHLSLTHRLIQKIHHRQINQTLQTLYFSLIVFYAYLLDFNPGILRVIINGFINFVYKYFCTKNKLTPLNKLGLNCCINIILCLTHATSYTLYFSYGVLLIWHTCQLWLNPKEKLFNFLCLNFLTFVGSSLIAGTIIPRINSLGLIYAQVFALPILCLHQILCWLVFIPHAWIFFYHVIQVIYSSIYYINQIDTLIIFIEQAQTSFKILTITFFIFFVIMAKKQKKSSFLPNKA
ncbi:hypothetical protein [Ureaplasma zalophigenitalium]|uniref:hypothetical protein n=1 Tax=Ureaplasma zalophigenitalium TaxID=907723 RepID=UPI0021E8FC8F|nr:hypothetical protein [Ureaplasma zalophigenitalium]